MSAKICQVVSSLRTGGMERVVCDLLAGMQSESTGLSGLHSTGRTNLTSNERSEASDREADQSISNCLFCTDAEGELYETAEVGAKACGWRKPGMLVIDWRLIGRLLRFLREQRVDLLHAHNHAPNLYCTIVSILTGIPVVVTRHGRGYVTFRWKLLTRLLSLRASKVVFVSEDARRLAIANHTVSATRSVVIQNGVDTRRFMPVKSGPDQPASGTPHLESKGAFRTQLGIPPDAVIISSVGRLAPEKNYPLLIGAFAQVVQDCKRDAAGDRQCHLLLVGDGSERPVLEGLIRQLRLTSHCTLVGMQDEVLPWLHQTDIFCLSSDTEGLSMTLLEAGACALPCVVTDVGGNREVVENGVTGLVVPKGDQLALSSALSRLIRDEALRQLMGTAARSRIEAKFTRATMVDAYKKLYYQVLGVAR